MTSPRNKAKALLVREKLASGPTRDPAAGVGENHPNRAINCFVLGHPGLNIMTYISQPNRQ